MSDNLADEIAAEQATEATPDPTPRRRSRARKASGTSTRKRSTSASADRKSVKKDLEKLLGTAGVIVSAYDPFDGAVLLANAEQTARALDDLARENASIHRIITMLTTGTGGYFGLAAALAPIVLPILHHHGLLRAVPMADAFAESMVPPEAKQAQEATEAVRQMMADAAADPAA